MKNYDPYKAIYGIRQDAANKNKQERGLDIKVVLRECLKCGKKFESKSKCNRMCYECKSTSSDNNIAPGFTYYL